MQSARHFEPDLPSWVTWVLPDRSLGREMARTLEVGHLRGADLWDERQRAVAETLGFRT